MSGLVIVLTLQMRRKEGHPRPIVPRVNHPLAGEPRWEDRPMTLDDSVHGLRLHAIQRAQAVGNVSAVCRDLGISRALFYRWRRRWERYGADGVHPRRQSAGPGRPIQVAPEVERVVLGLAISKGDLGLRAARGLSHAPLADSP